MGTRSALLVALIGVVTVGEAATAAFVNVTAEKFRGEGWVEHGYAGLTAWRIYANFDGKNSEDGVLAVFGIHGLPWSMRSSDRLFHNAEIDSLCPPEDLREQGIWENQWDTYLTIGATSSQGECGLTGFGGLRGDFKCTDCGVFVTPDDEIGRAVDGRVLLGQFVVARGEHVSGTVNLLLREGGQVEAVDIVTILCPADLDDSGAVDFGDILAILAAWGNKGGPEDLDGNGVVDFGDLLIVLAAWGPCP